MNDSTNYGISGVQNLTAENLAVGPASRIEQTNSSRSLESALSLLANAIDHFDASPDTRRELTEAHSEIAHELRSPAPDRTRISSKLAWMSGVAGSAGTLAQATTALAQLIGSLL